MATVTYDVGGTVKKVFEHVVRSKPETLLCTLLDDPARTSVEEPIFIDRSADLFDAIMDWYRHGFILPPLGIGLERMRLECAYYALPDDVEIRFEDVGGATHAFYSSRAHAKQAVLAEFAELQAKYHEVVHSLVAVAAYADILKCLGNEDGDILEAGVKLDLPVVRHLQEIKGKFPASSIIPMQINERFWAEVSRHLHERSAQNGLECILIPMCCDRNTGKDCSVKLRKGAREMTKQ
mmetsp:Transcript_72736/g.135912  ORF Transcript_72736/g.135912 Transcript_72736/m.135912 type:complete len:237 (+) Transcript_72736:84-794(+)